MDSFEWNKIFGAILASVLAIVGLNILVGKMMEAEPAKGPGMEVAVNEKPNGDGGTPAADVKPDWGTVLPVADVAAGEKVHAKCLQCHDFSKDGPNKIGPNLYGIVGAKHAHLASFQYSPAMAALSDKTWGYDELNEFVTNPKAAVAGTKMGFAGISKAQDRINLIAYLRTVSDSPLPIPAPNPVEPPASQEQAPPPGSTPPADGAAAPAPGGATPAAGATPPAPAGGVAPAAGAAPAAGPAPAAGAAPAPAAPTAPAPATPPGH